MRAELVPLARVERAFEQGAEDRGLDLPPIGLHRLDQQAEFHILGNIAKGQRIRKRATVYGSCPCPSKLRPSAAR